MEQLLSSNSKCQDSVIFVMLANGMIHDDVARELYEEGFEKILYLPTNLGLPYETRGRLRILYQYLCNEEFALLTDIPEYRTKDEWNRARRSDIKLIDDSQENRVSFWFPIRRIKISEKSKVDADSRGIFDIDATQKAWRLFSEKSFTSLTPYLNLYDFLSGNSYSQSELELYYTLCGKSTEDSKQVWLEDRKSLFEIFEDAIKYDLTLFTKGPSPCHYDGNGFLYGEEGAHRLAYFAWKQYTMAPVSLPRNEFLRLLKDLQ